MAQCLHESVWKLPFLKVFQNKRIVYPEKNHEQHENHTLPVFIESVLDIKVQRNLCDFEKYIKNYLVYFIKRIYACQEAR